MEKVQIIKHYLEHSFPVGFWINSENQRVFLETLAQEFHITKPSQWGEVNIDLLRKKKGVITLLNNYHNKSLFKALQANFPGTTLICFINQRNYMGKKMVWKKLSKKS